MREMRGIRSCEKMRWVWSLAKVRGFGGGENTGFRPGAKGFRPGETLEREPLLRHVSGVNVPVSQPQIRCVRFGISRLALPLPA